MCRGYVIAEVQKTVMDLLVFILRVADRLGRVFFFPMLLNLYKEAV